MKIAVLVLVLLFSSFILLSCKKDNPVEPPINLKDTVTISVEGVTHRSIELNVKSTMNNYQFSIKLSCPGIG